MHYIRIRDYRDYHSTGGNYRVERYCEWVKDYYYDDLATFQLYEEALLYAKQKAHEQGLKIIDEIADAEKGKSKKKKSGK